MPTFMEVGTELSALASKLDAIVEKAAASVSDAVIERIKTGKVTNSMETDIMNLLSDFPDDLKSRIYLKTIVIMAKQMSGNKSSGKVESKANSGMFANRGFL